MIPIPSDPSTASDHYSVWNRRPTPTTTRSSSRFAGPAVPLTLDVAYTYSHSLDNSSDKADFNFVDSSNVKKNYASSNFDQRHILTVSWVYDLPIFTKPGLTRSILGGWQYAGIMTAQSGEPFSVVDGVFGDSAGVANGTGTGSYADRVGNPYAIPPDTNIDPNREGADTF